MPTPENRLTRLEEQIKTLFEDLKEIKVTNREILSLLKNERLILHRLDEQDRKINEGQEDMEVIRNELRDISRFIENLKGRLAIWGFLAVCVISSISSLFTAMMIDFLGGAS